MNFPPQATEFTYYDGTTYIAKDANGFKSCVGCEFNKMDDCIVVPYCSPTFREDKRDIIWIKKEEKKMNPYIYYSANVLPYWYYVVVKQGGVPSNEFVAFAVIDDFGNLRRVNPLLRDVMEDDVPVWDIQGVTQ